MTTLEGLIVKFDRFYHNLLQITLCIFRKIDAAASALQGLHLGHGISLLQLPLLHLKLCLFALNTSTVRLMQIRVLRVGLFVRVLHLPLHFNLLLASLLYQLLLLLQIFERVRIRIMATFTLPVWNSLHQSDASGRLARAIQKILAHFAQNFFLGHSTGRAVNVCSVGALLELLGHWSYEQRRLDARHKASLLGARAGTDSEDSAA